MKVAVIGATGKAGRLIAREARMRGFDVTAITRASSVRRLEDDYPVIAKDLFELTTDDVRGFDILVNAFGTDFSKPGSEYLHVKAMEHLISILEPLPDLRFFVVGGAGSLFTDETRQHRVMESISDAMRAVPYNQFIAWQILEKSSVNYTFMSPAETFDYSGPRTGEYTLGTDVSIKNSMGLSYITYADFAVAMVDEFQNARFVRTRFTAVSESKFKNDAKNFFSIAGNPFTRRGAYFGIFSNGSSNYGGAQLYIGSRRGEVNLRPNNVLVNISPARNGTKIPYSVVTRPDELILRTQYGNIYCCMPESHLLYFRGEGGLSLCIDKMMERHEIMKPRGDKAWEGLFYQTCSLVFNPLRGNIEMDARWDWERLSTPIVHGEIMPDENGEFLLSVEEFTHGGNLRESYPTYDEGRAAVKADWEEFLTHVPDFGEEFKDERREAAYMTWSHIVEPSGMIRRPFLYMVGTNCGSAWQMCEAAVAVKNNLPLGIEFLLNMIDQQSPYGQLPDLYDSIKGSFMLYKPPIQGWALKELMKEHDFSTEVPRDKLTMMYDGFSRWADWFFKYRDDDHDGLPQYEHGNETGNDDSALFRDRYDLELPDLAAYLVLLDEALGDIAVILGRSDMADAHYKRSKDTLKRLIDAFWNGERFIGLTNGDHQEIKISSLILYRTIILGERLPRDILDKMVKDLTTEGQYLTPYGLLNVRMDSLDYNKAGFSNAFIGASDNILVITGMYNAGYKEIAKNLAHRFCKGVKMGGSSYYGVRPGFSGSWTASAFQILADVAHNWQ